MRREGDVATAGARNKCAGVTMPGLCRPHGIQIAAAAETWGIVAVVSGQRDPPLCPFGRRRTSPISGRSFTLRRTSAIAGSAIVRSTADRAGRPLQWEPSVSSSLAHHDQRQRVALLAGIALASIILWQTALGSLLLYPFTILATWFHEMGHGIAAMLTGRGFERLVIFSDGSGFAESLRPADGYRLTDALVAASGPLGPALAGALLIVASRSPAATQGALAVLGALLVVSTLIWVRSADGLAGSPRTGHSDRRADAAWTPALAELRHPAPRRPGGDQRMATIRLSVQRGRKCRRPAAAIGHRRHRGCPAPSDANTGARTRLPAYFRSDRIAISAGDQAGKMYTVLIPASPFPPNSPCATLWRCWASR